MASAKIREHFGEAGIYARKAATAVSARGLTVQVVGALPEDVIGRALRQLESAGAIRLERHRILVVSPEKLRELMNAEKRDPAAIVHYRFEDAADFAKTLWDAAYPARS